MSHQSRGARSRGVWFDRDEWHWKHESCPVCGLCEAIEGWLESEQTAPVAQSEERRPSKP